MVVGGTAGYVLGTRAGQQRYQQITRTAKRVGERAAAKLDQLSGQAADKLQARQPTALETPPEPPSMTT